MKNWNYLELKIQKYKNAQQTGICENIFATILGNNWQFTQWENPPDKDCIAVNSSTGVWQGDECDNANSFICMKRFVGKRDIIDSLFTSTFFKLAII